MADVKSSIAHVKQKKVHENCKYFFYKVNLHEQFNNQHELY